LGEWVPDSLRVTDVQPNHGWRHLWREMVRGTKIKPELCDYMCGHEGKSGASARYGKRQVPALATLDGAVPAVQNTRAQATADAAQAQPSNSR
jgi:acetyl-CoA acetyltransferase